MSSSLTLEPMKTISDSTNQSSCTQPSSSSNMVDAANPISENHTETSWKFLSQIIEEQDIMTGGNLFADLQKYPLQIRQFRLLKVLSRWNRAKDQAWTRSPTHHQSL